MNSQTQVSSDLSTDLERLKSLAAKFERQCSQLTQTDRKLILLTEERRKQRRSFKRNLDEIVKIQKDFVATARSSQEKTLDQEVLKEIERNIATLEQLQTALLGSKNLSQH